MRNIYKHDPIRIPVKLVGEQWEYFYGGGLPIRNGSIGDLLVDKSAIEDPKFLAKLKRPSKHKILEVGTSLLVALTVRPQATLTDELKNHLLLKGKEDLELGDAYYYTPRSANTKFISIEISGPTERQKRFDPNEQGGVWIHMEGLQPKGVSSSTVRLPKEVSENPAESLNHAFTLLSEKYEPWRKSHTGNIYDRMLYQEQNKKWYPLNILRNAAIAEDEHQLMREQWVQICQKLNIKLNADK
jgi:hypothetical protein